MSQQWQMISYSSVQIGSYFGSVLQTVDVDNDSYTDLLLVGAPMYMGSEKNEQGQVYVYKLNQVQKMKAESVFWLKSLCRIFVEDCDDAPTFHSVHDLFFFFTPSSGRPVSAPVHFKAYQSVLLYCPLRDLH